MTQEEIIEMTRQAGGFSPTPEFLEAFAKLVAEREREACAIACETDGRDLASLYYAGVIRARGEA